MDGVLDRGVLVEEVPCAVEIAQAENTFLFGSATRERMAPGNGLDLLLGRTGVARWAL